MEVRDWKGCSRTHQKRNGTESGGEEREREGSNIKGKCGERERHRSSMQVKGAAHIKQRSNQDEEQPAVVGEPVLGLCRRMKCFCMMGPKSDSKG